MAVVSVSVVPLGTGTPSLSSYVAKCEKVLEKYNTLRYQLTPMATIIEGDLDTILEAIKEMHKVPFKHGAQRVSTRLTIDERIDKPLSMESKIQAVQEKKER